MRQKRIVELPFVDADLTTLIGGVEALELSRELQHELNFTGFAAMALVRLHDAALNVMALLEVR